MMGSLMELFGRAPAAAASTSTTTELPKNPASVDANPTVPNANTLKSDGSVKAIPAAGEGSASPLEEFATLWQAPDPKTTPATPSMRPNFKIDDKVIRDNASKIDFAKLIPADVITKAVGGDTTAFATAINLTAQAAFAQSAKTTAQMVQAALDRQADVFETQYAPEMFRRNAISQEVRADNPIFENPAVAPVLASIEAQLVAKNPGKTPAEISTMAKSFFAGMSEAFLAGSGKVVSDAPVAAKKSKGTTDWESYFNGPSQV